MRVTIRNLHSYASQSTNARKIWVVMSTCNLPRPTHLQEARAEMLPKLTFFLSFRSKEVFALRGLW